MIPFEEVEEMVGHAPGGVCPFGIKEGIVVYLDESLKRFETVYPAAGNSNSAVKLTISQLEQAMEAKGWEMSVKKYQFEEKFLRFFIRCFYSDFLLFL